MGAQVEGQDSSTGGSNGGRRRGKAAELAPPSSLDVASAILGETLWLRQVHKSIGALTCGAMELGLRGLPLTPCVTLVGSLPYLCLGFPIHEMTGQECAVRL